MYKKQVIDLCISDYSFFAYNFILSYTRKRWLIIMYFLKFDIFIDRAEYEEINTTVSFQALILHNFAVIYTAQLKTNLFS